MIKKFVQTFIKTVQKILITISLLLIYIIGIGVTAFCAMLFNRRIPNQRHKEKNTFWIEAKGYECDIDDCMRQS